MNEPRTYILKEQTEEFLDKARSKFSIQSASLPTDPMEIVTIVGESKIGNSYRYAYPSKDYHPYVSKEIFDQFFKPYYPDDQHLLNSL